MSHLDGTVLPEATQDAAKPTVLIFRRHQRFHCPQHAVAQRIAEQLGWDDTPAGQQKRQEDLALLQELMAATEAASSPLQRIANRTTGEQD